MNMEEVSLQKYCRICLRVGHSLTMQGVQVPSMVRHVDILNMYQRTVSWLYESIFLFKKAFNFLFVKWMLHSFKKGTYINLEYFIAAHTTLPVHASHNLSLYKSVLPLAIYRRVFLLPYNYIEILGFIWLHLF